MLQYDPKKRITVEEALKHPYVADFADETDEIVCKVPIKMPIDDDTKVTRDEYRRTL